MPHFLHAVRFKVAVKLGVAGGLAMAAAGLYHSRYPIYAVVAVAMVMEGTLASTFRSGVNRLLGTAVGAAVGGVLAAGFSANPFTIGLGFAVVALVCSALGWADALKLSALVVAVVLLQHSDRPFLFAALRLLDTATGVAIASAVNALLWPARSWARLREGLSELLDTLGRLYGQVYHAYVGGEYPAGAIEPLAAKARAALVRTDRLWADAAHELPGRLKLGDTWRFLPRRLYQHVMAMSHAAAESDHDRCWCDLAPDLDRLASETSDAFARLSAAVAAGAARPPLPPLEEELARAGEHLAHLRLSPSGEHSAAEVLRFAAFYYNMDSVAHKLRMLDDAL